MNNLEEEYAEGIEREEEILLEGLQNKRSLADLEKLYSQKVKEIRRIYEKSLKKELNKEKEVKEKENTKKSEKHAKEFSVQNLNLQDKWGEKKQIEISSFSYKIGRKVKNFTYNITPNWIIYTYHKTKISLRNFFKETRSFSKRIFDKISGNILNILIYIKEGFMKVVSELKNILILFKGKKTKEKKGENKEGEKKEDANKDR